MTICRLPETIVDDCFLLARYPTEGQGWVIPYILYRFRAGIPPLRRLLLGNDNCAIAFKSTLPKVCSRTDKALPPSPDADPHPYLIEPLSVNHFVTAASDLPFKDILDTSRGSQIYAAQTAFLY